MFELVLLGIIWVLGFLMGVWSTLGVKMYRVYKAEAEE